MTPPNAPPLQRLGLKMDYIAKEAVAEVDWEAGGSVHNWRNYIGDHTRAVWASLSDEVKIALALDADESARREHWE